MKIYNTMSKQKEEFVPIEEGKIRMYVCGPTVYNLIHIGNARPMIVFDTFRRFMEYKGYKVCYVSNYTDVDDKIIKTAMDEGTDCSSITERYISEVEKDMSDLNIMEATAHPKATEEIQGMVNLIDVLVKKGFAYPVEGTVYYDTTAFPSYGKLSHKNMEDLRSGLRELKVSGEEEKKSPTDFVLWKPKKMGEPYWNSPWSEGRPGWHTECCVMAPKYCGGALDIHAGGEDLVFPHHENEIAQSEGCSGQHPVVRYWLHNGFITINSEKMSKSLNNFFLVKDILEQYSPDALRYFLLSTHYRSPLDFSDERLEEANKSLERLSTAIENLLYLEKCEPGPCDEAQRLLEKAKEYEEEFEAAMSDDFNTALATSSMFGLAKEINIYYQAVTGREGVVCQEAIAEVKRIFKFMTEVIGILEKAWEGNTGANAAEYEELMQVILSVRQACRDQKQWGLADCIRDRLSEIGITIEDSPQGARWKKREV